MLLVVAMLMGGLVGIGMAAFMIWFAEAPVRWETEDWMRQHQMHYCNEKDDRRVWDGHEHEMTWRPEWYVER